MAASASYSRLQIGLHWLIAVLILALWLIEAEAIHIPLGLVMLAALGLRIGMRHFQGVPGLVPGTSSAMARAPHWGLSHFIS